MQPLMETDAIFAYLGIGQTTFYRIIAEDDTFPVRKIRGRWKADPEELKEWFRNQRSTPDHRNVVEITRPRRGRPPLSRTSPKRQVK
jgi:predicted DNA-binding transcriptional regulator AlpA